MPMTFTHKTEDYTIAVWHTTEDLTELSKDMHLDLYTSETLKTCKPHRRRELLGTRHLLNVLLDQSVTIKRGPNGRPLIIEYPDLNLSLSHSGEYSAVMLSRVHSHIGVDIQVHRDKISRIAPKFMTTEEVNMTSVAQQHYYWGIKESVFKAWSRGGVNFKEMIKITPFDINAESTLHVNTTTLFCKDEVEMQYDALGIVLKDLYLSWVIPSSTHTI